MKWYAAETRSGNEANAERDLNERGSIQTFYPRVKVRRIRVRRGSPVIKWVETSLFPRYLFIRAPLEQLWIAWRCGCNLITFGLDPEPIADEVMQVLMAGADETGLIKGSKDEVNRARFKAAQQVKFIAGPLIGLIAQVVQDSHAEDVKVLLELFGSKREVNAKADSLEAA